MANVEPTGSKQWIVSLLVKPKSYLANRLVDEGSPRQPMEVLDPLVAIVPEPCAVSGAWFGGVERWRVDERLRAERGGEQQEGQKSHGRSRPVPPATASQGSGPGMIPASGKDG